MSLLLHWLCIESFGVRLLLESCKGLTGEYIFPHVYAISFVTTNLKLSIFIFVIFQMNLAVFIMAIRVTLTGNTKSPEFQSTKSGLRSAGILLPLLGITWVFGLLAVNQDMVLYQYLFAVFNCLLGLFIFLFHCILNTKVRREWLRCCLGMQGKKVQFDESVNTSVRLYDHFYLDKG